MIYKAFNQFSKILVISLIIDRLDGENILPTFLIHGFNSGAESLRLIISFIKEAYPDAICVTPNLYPNQTSALPLWIQARDFAEYIRHHPSYTPSGVNLLGYSQGVSISRAVLVELGPDHYVRSLICLSGPAMGQYGIPNLGGSFTNALKCLDTETAYLIFYNPLVQNIFSIANMWNDPCHQDLYLQLNIYLPKINNQIEHDRNEDYKKSYLKLDILAAIGGPNDTTIIPWQSAQFSFYDCERHVVPMEELDVYKRDLFGLKTLNEDGRFNACTVEGINHGDWARSKLVADKCILPFLIKESD